MKVDAVEITTHIINGRLRATNEMRVKNFHNQKGRRNCHRLVKTCTVALPEAKEKKNHCILLQNTKRKKLRLSSLYNDCAILTTQLAKIK